MDKTLRSVLEEIKTQTGKNIIFNDYLVEGIKINCNINGETAESALNKLLYTEDLSVKEFDGNNLVIFKKDIPKQKKFKAVIINNSIAEADTAFEIIAPTFCSNIRPEYPQEAVKNNIEGNVTVKILVTKDGEVSKSLIIKSSGYSVLDSAAISYLRKTKFTPAFIKGKPQNLWVSMGFSYRIENVK